jgi:hypothetical protein
MATCFIIFFLTIKSVQKRTILLYLLPKQGALYCSSGTSAASVLPYSRPSSFSPGLRPGTGVPSPTPVPAFGWDFSAQSRPSAAKLGVSFSFFRHCVWLGSDPGAAGAWYRYDVRMTSSGPGPDHHTPRLVPYGAQVPA